MFMGFVQRFRHALPSAFINICRTVFGPAAFTSSCHCCTSCLAAVAVAACCSNPWLPPWKFTPIWDRWILGGWDYVRIVNPMFYAYEWDWMKIWFGVLPRGNHIGQLNILLINGGLMGKSSNYMGDCPFGVFTHQVLLHPVKSHTPGVESQIPINGHLHDIFRWFSIDRSTKKSWFPTMELISGSSRPECSRPLWQLNLSRQVDDQGACLVHSHIAMLVLHRIIVDVCQFMLGMRLGFSDVDHVCLFWLWR